MSDSRTARNELKEFFGGPVSMWASQFTGPASLVSPATGRHIRVYQLALSAPSSNSNEVEAEIRDGDTVRALLFVPAGGVRYLKFDGRYLRFDTSVRVTRISANDPLAVTVVYKDVESV